MARPLRVEREGAVYHILSRGDKAEHIFKEIEDKEYFLGVLRKAEARFGMEIYVKSQQAVEKLCL
jgi:putative transposase